MRTWNLDGMERREMLAEVEYQHIQIRNISRLISEMKVMGKGRNRKCLRLIETASNRCDDLDDLIAQVGPEGATFDSLMREYDALIGPTTD